MSTYHLNTFLFCFISCRTTTASFQSSLTVLENPVAKSTDISMVTKSRLTDVSCRVHQDQEAGRVQSNHTARLVYPTWRVTYRPSAYPSSSKGGLVIVAANNRALVKKSFSSRIALNNCVNGLARQHKDGCACWCRLMSVRWYQLQARRRRPASG